MVYLWVGTKHTHTHMAFSLVFFKKLIHLEKEKDMGRQVVLPSNI